MSFFNFYVKMNFTITTLIHFPRTHYSTIPVFQYSNTPATSVQVADRLGRIP